MESHKRVLGILYVISGVMLMMFIVFMSLFMGTILTLVTQELDSGEAQILEMVMGILRFIPAFIILFFSIPSVIAGIGLIYKQKWALILALILGCFKLFSFPIGTALGVYTIWVYAEDGKCQRHGFPQPKVQS